MSRKPFMPGQPRRKIGGVTLIEMMIGIVILSLLLSFALPGFGVWIQNSQIRTSAESIQNGLNLARAEAVRRNVLVSFVFTNTAPAAADVNTIVAAVDGINWMVRLFEVNGVYAAGDFIQSRAGADGTPNVAVATTLATITFNSLGRVTPTPAADIVIDVTNASGTRPLDVVVTPGGQIRMCDPALPATNVQSC